MLGAAAILSTLNPIVGLLGTGAGMFIGKNLWISRMSRNARTPIASFRHCGQERTPVYFGYAAQEGAWGFPSDKVLYVRQGTAHHCARDTEGQVPHLADGLRFYLRQLWQASGCSGIGDMRTPFWAAEETKFRAALAGCRPPEDIAEIEAIAEAAGMVEIQQDGPGGLRTGLRPAGAIWYLANQRIAGEELIVGADGKNGDTFKFGDFGDNAQVMAGSQGGSQSRSQDQYNAGVTGAQGPGSHGTAQVDWLDPDLVADLVALHKHLQGYGAREITTALAVAEAEIAAGKHDGAGVRAALARAGKQALQAAQAIGLQVAETAITKAMGLS
jgi:hypothetical protein